MEKVKNLLVFSINMKDLPNGVALVWGGPFGETTWADVVGRASTDGGTRAI
jgi:hypothetical protein